MSVLLRLCVAFYCASVFVFSNNVPVKDINISMSMVLEKVEEMKTKHAQQISKLKSEYAHQISDLKSEILTIKDKSSRHNRDLGDGLNIAFTSYMNHDENAIGQNQVLVFNKVILNDGNGYSMHTGAFTAPMAGIYHFDFFIGERDVNQLYVILAVNGVNMVDGVVETITAAQDAQGGNAANLKLAKGDVVYVKHLIGSHIEGAESARISTFSGFLLYPVESEVGIIGK